MDNQIIQHVLDIISNTSFQIALKLCIDHNKIRYMRKIPILPNVLAKLASFVIFLKYNNNCLINATASGDIEITTLT